VPAKVLEGGEQQLLEACELLLLQRCFRELLLEEFVTTLHLVGCDLETSFIVAHASWGGGRFEGWL
jgi:hypothetical protein